MHARFGQMISHPKCVDIGSNDFGEALTVSFGNVIDQFHDEHRLANTSTTKKTNLTTFLIGCEKINNL